MTPGPFSSLVPGAIAIVSTYLCQMALILCQLVLDILVQFLRLLSLLLGLFKIMLSLLGLEKNKNAIHCFC